MVIASGRLAPVLHRCAAAWAKFWSICRHLTTKAIPMRARMARLRAEVFPVVIWGCASWVLPKDALDQVEGAIYRMTTCFAFVQAR